MLTAIQETYEDGQIIWDETPPIKKRSKVIVTFLESESITKVKLPEDDLPNKRGIRFGSLTGKIDIPADFNEPLNDLNEYM